MDAKTFFREIRLERREIRILTEQIYAKEMDLLPSGIRYDRDQIQSSIEDKITKKLAELGDYERKREKLLKSLTQRQAKAIDIVANIPDTKQRQVMEIYYFDPNNPTWDDVSSEMGYDRRWVLRVHGAALGWINDHVKIK